MSDDLELPDDPRRYAERFEIVLRAEIPRIENALRAKALKGDLPESSDVDYTDTAAPVLVFHYSDGSTVRHALALYPIDRDH